MAETVTSVFGGGLSQSFSTPDLQRNRALSDLY